MFKMHELFTDAEIGAQYETQSMWSDEVFEHFWPRAIPAKVLDVGCGPRPTYLLRRDAGLKVGVDIDRRVLGKIGGEISRVEASAMRLPFRDETFDVVCCQYLLLWVPMRQVLAEMWRVTAPGGRLICGSEPDYSGRKEDPDALTEDLKIALRKLGADPEAAARLEEELKALSHKVEVGILEQVKEKSFQLKELRNDITWLETVLEKDLGMKAKPLVEALEQNKGSIYMPVHYACAFKV